MCDTVKKKVNEVSQIIDLLMITLNLGYVKYHLMTVFFIALYAIKFFVQFVYLKACGINVS